MKMSPAHREAPGRSLMRELLSERNQYPERAEAIDARIRSVFERKLAVLVLDMVGFTNLSKKLGIISYLAMIAKMVAAGRPAILANGGRVIKVEADNLFAVFDRVDDALEAGLAIFASFDAINGVVPDDHDIHGSIGIGYGPILVVDDEDLFGCEMNLASKLGEDIAGSTEILLSLAAYEALAPAEYPFDSCREVIGGEPLDFFRYRREVDPDGVVLMALLKQGRSLA